ncbi:MAG: four helix bundle protein [Spirulina sp. SIO3F2]|nr:four helix bundle protein [Spirulina sp. SIO3F2]
MEIEERTFAFAVRMVKLCQFLEEQLGVARTLANQLLRSGTSIGANVAESQAAQSRKDFIHKLEISLKEARETQYWLRLLIATELISIQRLQTLLDESIVITKILAKIVISTKKNMN